MISSVEHLFICLLAIYIFSLEQGLFGSSAEFKSDCSVFWLLSCMRYLCILNIYPLSDKCFANNFSHSVCFLLILLLVNFAVQKPFFPFLLFIFMRYSWCTILYKLQVYTTVIHSFKGYTPFIVFTVTVKYWLYFLCCTIYPCRLFIFVCSSSYLFFFFYLLICRSILAWGIFTCFFYKPHPIGCGVCPGLGGWASQDTMPHSLSLGEPVPQPLPCGMLAPRPAGQQSPHSPCRASSQLQGWRQSSLAAWSCCSELRAPCAPAPSFCSWGRSEASQALPGVGPLKLRGQNSTGLPFPALWLSLPLNDLRSPGIVEICSSSLSLFFVMLS